MDGRSWDEVQQNATVRKRLAKLMARDCFRNTGELENLHAEGRLDDQEMKALMIEVVDQCYDVLMELVVHTETTTGSSSETQFRAGTILK